MTESIQGIGDWADNRNCVNVTFREVKLGRRRVVDATSRMWGSDKQTEPNFLAFNV